jgi:hypothetical protein
MSAAPPDAQPSRWRAGRIVALVMGVLVGLLAAAILAAAGVLLWGNNQKGDDGYLQTGPERLTAAGYAVTSDNLDLDLDGPNWVVDRDRYGKIRIRVTPQTPTGTFVGIAPTSAVDRYLGAVARSEVTDVDVAPLRVQLEEHAGQAPAGPPASRRIWSASATGTGTQTMTWDVREGDWTIVVMNADGSRGIDAGVSAGARVPWLGTAGWVTLGVGLLALFAAIALIVFGVRRPPGGARPVPAPAPPRTGQAASA